MSAYPGTKRHQALLEAVVACYARDPRIRAVALFGSLARGNWDADSDLDVDIVVFDGTPVDTEQEVGRLAACLAPLGEQMVVMNLDRRDSADIILRSLQRLSIRYHELETTSPNVVESLRVLAGSLEAAVIKAAGEANRSAAAGPAIETILGELAWRALDVDTALRRSHVWQAIDGMQDMRGTLMELFARTRHGARPVQFFDSTAEAGLQADLGATLPGYDSASMRLAFRQMLQLIQDNFAAWANGQVELTQTYAELFSEIEIRQDQGVAR